jgi:hypothetical protein
MAFIDGTVVNVALPEIQARLNATAVDSQRIKKRSEDMATWQMRPVQCVARLESSPMN